MHSARSISTSAPPSDRLPSTAALRRTTAKSPGVSSTSVRSDAGASRPKKVRNATAADSGFRKPSFALNTKRRSAALSSRSPSLVVHANGSGWLSIQVSISLTCVTSQDRCAPRRSAISESASSKIRNASVSRASAKARAMFRSVSPTYMPRRSEARLCSTSNPSRSAR